MTAPLTPSQFQRYARHLTLPEVGASGQQKLAEARVLLIGAGGLGSPAGLYLAAAGVGTIGLIDDDVVDVTNLQRQVLHDTPSIGERKVDSAVRRLNALNPDVNVVPIGERLTSENSRALFRQYDLIIDGSDNFPTRYLVNDTCVLEQVPFVYGSIYRFEGQLSIFATAGGPCYRCLFAEPPAPELVPSCVDAGVLGVLPGIIGTLQALEAIKWILGLGDSAVGRLLLFDAMSLRMREIELRRDPECPVCGPAATQKSLIDYDAFCGNGAVRGNEIEVAPAELLAELDRVTVIDVREPWEYEVAHLEGSRLIPLGELAGRIAQLPKDARLMVVCHHGSRSLAAARLLKGAGFGAVQSLAGGIDAWAVEIDPAMQRY